MPDDPHIFHEPRLGFRLRKPDAWDFMPPAWSPVQKLKNISDDAEDWIHRANQPFCCALKHHDSDRHAYPTLQVTARPGQAGEGDAQRLLQAQLDMLQHNYPDIEFLAATCDALIGGCRANVIEALFPLKISKDGTLIEIGVRSRSCLLFGRRYAFTVGLSGSDDPVFTDTRDFDFILASVKIDK